MKQRLCTPVDIASLVVFRIAFGVVLAWHFVSDIASGRLALQYLQPHFLFKYPGFAWVEPLPGQGMVILYWALAGLALLVATGLFYRVSATLLCLGFTYTFLLDQARYQNHLYLTCLLCFLLIFIPAHRAGSLDAARRAGWRRDVVPAWGLGALRFQLAVVYVFGGIAKLNGDWLLRAQPMRLWLAQEPPGTLRLPFFAEPWFGYLISWGGLLFDLGIVPLLLWRRTRLAAFAVSLAFHLINSQLFNIGYFPWLMALATTVFFPPDWPRRLGLSAAKAVPAIKPGDRWTPKQHLGLALAGVYAVAQLLIPLRHLAIPGDVSWTEEGHRFAWRMKLRDKQGDVQLFWLHPDKGKASPLDPATVLTAYQQKKMRHDPRLVHQLVLAVADGLRRKGQRDVDIRVRSEISLNGREPQPIIDSGINLASEPRSFSRAGWIVPLRSPAAK